MKRERPFARIRKERDYPLEWAATLLNISPGYLRRVELGRLPLSWGLAQRMCRLYQTNLAELTQ
jgi:DNA-binding XRE family transcriptional regulator